MALRLAPWLAASLLLLPTIFGVCTTLLLALGWFPVLGGQTLTLKHFQQLFSEPGIYYSAGLSFFVGIGTTALALAMTALIFAAWSGTRWFERIRHILSPVLAIPHAAMAFGISFLIAPSGWLIRLIFPHLTGFNRPPDWLIIADPFALSMLFALVIKELPFLFLVSIAAFAQTRPGQIYRVSASLGYGRIAGFLLFNWPLLYRQIRLPVFAVMAYSSSVVDVALILGPTNPPPLVIKILIWTNNPELNTRFVASAGAILQLLTSLSAVVTWVFLEKLGSVLSSLWIARGNRFQHESFVKLGLGFIGSILTLLAGMAVLVLLIWSFAGRWPFPDAFPTKFVTTAWQKQGPIVGPLIGNTFLIAAISVSICVILIVACLEQKDQTGNNGGQKALLATYFPLLVPQITFVFGLQMFFLVVGMDGSLPALILSHMVFVFPYVYLSLAGAWRSLDKRCTQVALSLGKSKGFVLFNVKIPILLFPMLSAAALGFAVSISQYLPTLLIGAGRWPTITTEAVALASGGDRRIMALYAFVQLLLPAVGFSLAALIPAVVYRKQSAMGSHH